MNNKRLSYTRALEDIRFVLRQIGLKGESFGTHSFRAGGATTAAQQGVQHELIKNHGRWKTDTAKDLYLRYNDKVKLLVSNNLNL